MAQYQRSVLQERVITYAQHDILHCINISIIDICVHRVYRIESFCLLTYVWSNFLYSVICS